MWSRLLVPCEKEVLDIFIRIPGLVRGKQLHPASKRCLQRALDYSGDSIHHTSLGAISMMDVKIQNSHSLDACVPCHKSVLFTVQPFSPPFLAVLVNRRCWSLILASSRTSEFWRRHQTWPVSWHVSDDVYERGNSTTVPSESTPTTKTAAQILICHYCFLSSLSNFAKR